MDIVEITKAHAEAFSEAARKIGGAIITFAHAVSGRENRDCCAAAHEVDAGRYAPRQADRRN